ncbi:hypothetical protein ASE95_02885 [Sphingomonas sp. Leaf231]|nr:hypothetical protein ASE95_02885 [Sphingomonas sp. Leaf231]
MAGVLHSNEITSAADGRARAEEVRRSNPLPPTSSGFVETDEAPGIVASVERVNAWMEVAEAGDRFVYATRAMLPFRSPGAARMRSLAERKLVLLVRPRSTSNPELFNYTAVRTTVPSVLRKPVRGTLSACLIDAEAATVDALMPILDRAARFGRPCPTDKQMAERTGLTVEAVAGGIEVLVLAGLIRVFAAPRPTLRRVVILATGHQTGDVFK